MKGVYAAVGLHPIDLIDEAEDTVTMDGKLLYFQKSQEDFDQEISLVSTVSDKVVGLARLV